MNQNIHLIVFGTFGNPNGFRQTILNHPNEKIQLNVKTFDLKTDAITLYANTKVYAVRKEIANGNKGISFSVYTYAKEKNSDRGGTFIGSSVIFINAISEPNQIVSCLNELNDNLILNNIKNDTILVNHSDEFLKLEWPRSYSNFKHNLKEIKNINFQNFSNNNIVVYAKTDVNTLSMLFEKSTVLLNNYDTIYFTESHDVATYVQKKGLFGIIPDFQSFEKEIQKIEEEKLKKVEAAIIELQNDKILFENEKLRNIENLKNLIEQSEKVHQDNKRRIDESRHELNQIYNRYNGFYNKIDELVNKLKLGQSYAEIRLQHNENKRRFIDSINQQNSNANISRVETNKDKRISQDIYGKINDDSSRHKHNESASDNSYIFIGTSIFLFLLWAGTLIYFLWIKPPEIVISSESTQEEVQTENQLDSSIDNDKNIIIEPQTNSELSVKEYTSIAKKIAPEMQLDQIVDIIYANSSNNVSTYYGGQKDAYSKLLLQLNKDCFITKGNYTIFHKDTLRHIPIYKQPK